MSYVTLIGGVVVAVIAVLSFAAGAATGAQFDQAEFRDVFWPAFSALGGWVSGIGALAAVGAALISRRDLIEQSRESLIVTDSGDLDMATNELCMRFDVVSKGRLPVRIQHVYLGDKENPKSWALENYLVPSPALPIILEYADITSLQFNKDVKLLIKKASEFMQPIDLENMVVCIETTLGVKVVPFPKWILNSYRHDLGL